MVDQYNQEQEILNYRTAMILAMQANCYRNPKKQKKPFKPQDFMPKKELTEDQMMLRAKAIVMTMGGEIK